MYIYAYIYINIIMIILKTTGKDIEHSLLSARWNIHSPPFSRNYCLCLPLKGARWNPPTPSLHPTTQVPNPKPKL